MPTMLLSGEFDPTVPPQMAQVAAEMLSNELSWFLYAFEVQEYPIHLGLAESENGTLILIVQSTVDEGDMFYEKVFLPMVDALVPLDIDL